MEVFDLKSLESHTYQERARNIFYQASNFKARVIELPAGGEMPTCEMDSYVVFTVIKGKALVIGVIYMNIAGFTTTLMMVGVLTYPVEKEYLGRRITILRNIISFLVAVIITLIIGLLYGEVI